MKRILKPGGSPKKTNFLLGMGAMEIPAKGQVRSSELQILYVHMEASFIANPLGQFSLTMAILCGIQLLHFSLILPMKFWELTSTHLEIVKLRNNAPG